MPLGEIMRDSNEDSQSQVEIREIKEQPLSDKTIATPSEKSELAGEQYPWQTEIADEAEPAGILDHHKKIFEQIKKLEGYVLKEVIQTYLDNNIKQLFKKKIPGSYGYAVDIFVFIQDKVKDDDIKVMAWRVILQIITCSMRNGSKLENMQEAYLQIHDMIACFKTSQEVLLGDFFKACKEVGIEEQIKVTLKSVKTQISAVSCLFELQRLTRRSERDDQQRQLSEIVDEALNLLTKALLETDEKIVKDCVGYFNTILNRYMISMANEIKTLKDFELVKKIVEPAVVFMKEFERLRDENCKLQYPGAISWESFVLVKESFCDWLVVNSYNEIIASIASLKNISKERIDQLCLGDEKVAVEAFGAPVFSLLQSLAHFDNKAADSKRLSDMQQYIAACLNGLSRSLTGLVGWRNELKDELTKLQAVLGKSRLIFVGPGYNSTDEDGFCVISSSAESMKESKQSTSNSGQSEHKTPTTSIKLLADGKTASPVFSSQMQVQSAVQQQIGVADELMVVNSTKPTK